MIEVPKCLTVNNPASKAAEHKVGNSQEAFAEKLIFKFTAALFPCDFFQNDRENELTLCSKPFLSDLWN